MNEEDNLTYKERTFLSRLRGFYVENGYFPTIREFGALMGFSSPATTKYYYDILEKKKMIKRVNDRKIIFLGDEQSGNNTNTNSTTIN